MSDGYIYYCPMRPPTVGSVPTFGLMYVDAYTERRYIAAIDRMAWGLAAYNRVLRPEEVFEYELIAKPREG